MCVYKHKFWGKNLPIIVSEMWYVFDFSRKFVVIVVQSGLKLYDLRTRLLQRSHHVLV